MPEISPRLLHLSVAPQGEKHLASISSDSATLVWTRAGFCDRVSQSSSVFIFDVAERGSILAAFSE